MPVTYLHEELAQQLDDAIVVDVPGFVEHVFPDDSLPVTVDVFLEALTGMRNTHAMLQQRTLRKPDCSWVTFPPAKQDRPESFATHLAAFLNSMSDTMRDVCRLSGGTLPKKKRRWSSTYAARTSLPLPGYCVADHPALVLFDGKPEDEGWHTAISVIETVLSDVNSALCRLIHDASDTFYNQDDRRFQISLTFAARTARLVLIDHSGVVASEFFNIDEQPELLVRSVAGLMFSNRHTMGYDTTITTLKNGQRQIKVGQDVYDLVARLCGSRDVRGKATVCWHARRGGVNFVIKDNWLDTKHAHVEASVLKVAHGIPGIPKLVALEQVVINRTKDTTGPLRTILSGASSGIRLRIHHRMVMSPFAQKIEHFRSKKELISVFVDVIEAHRSLVEENVLHCDISSNNIMISDAAQETSTPYSAFFGQPLGRGLLIDVDSAMPSDKIGYWVGLVGTFMFMSSAILIRGSSAKQKPSDDLESFWWVLIYLCVRYAGPHNTLRPDYVAAFESMPVFSRDQANAYNIGRLKKHILAAKGALESDIFPMFSGYFEDLKPCMAELRTAYKSSNKFTYDAMLDVLRRTRDALPVVED
ncbi:hypothetical protein DFH06DRAFT_1320392 [Mycena polygramma]|nr:hypothetical protein DFH06DRAFT_1320392 [Mycena polygramma]